MRLGPHFVWATPCVKREKSRTAKSAKHTHHYKLDSSQNQFIYFLDVVISRSWSACKSCIFHPGILRRHPACLRGPSWLMTKNQNDQHRHFGQRRAKMLKRLYRWHAPVTWLRRSYCWKLHLFGSWNALGFYVLHLLCTCNAASGGTGTVSDRDHDVLPRTRSGLMGSQQPSSDAVINHLPGWWSWTWGRLDAT